MFGMYVNSYFALLQVFRVLNFFKSSLNTRIQYIIWNHSPKVLTTNALIVFQISLMISVMMTLICFTSFIPSLLTLYIHLHYFQFHSAKNSFISVYFSSDLYYTMRRDL